ncbi:hypothetical protein [Algoriphagus boritolerans]|uniref:hypothetical protein n=1 Tax=Algoriphagus boritolerans TaxID=308111 RepID=UPI002FCDEA1F
MTRRSIELNTAVPNEDAHTQFLAIDFGVCQEHGKIVPKLIEVQGFPSIFNFQFNLYRKILTYYPFLNELSPYPDGVDESVYLRMLTEVILGDTILWKWFYWRSNPKSKTPKLTFTMPIGILEFQLFV